MVNRQQVAKIGDQGRGRRDVKLASKRFSNEELPPDWQRLGFNQQSNGKITFHYPFSDWLISNTSEKKNLSFFENLLLLGVQSSLENTGLNTVLTQCPQALSVQ